MPNRANGFIHRCSGLPDAELSNFNHRTACHQRSRVWRPFHQAPARSNFSRGERRILTTFAYYRKLKGGGCAPAGYAATGGGSTSTLSPYGREDLSERLFDEVITNIETPLLTHHHLSRRLLCNTRAHREAYCVKSLVPKLL